MLKWAIAEKAPKSPTATATASSSTTTTLRERLEAFVANATAPSAKPGAARPLGQGRQDERALVHLLGRHGLVVASTTKEEPAATIIDAMNNPARRQHIQLVFDNGNVPPSELLLLQFWATTTGTTIIVVDGRRTPVTIRPSTSTTSTTSTSTIGVFRHRPATPARVWSAITATANPPAPPTAPSAPAAATATRTLLDMGKAREGHAPVHIAPADKDHIRARLEPLLRDHLYVVCVLFFTCGHIAARFQRKLLFLFSIKFITADTTATHVPRGAVKAFFDKAVVRAIVPQHLHHQQATQIAQKLKIDCKTVWAEVWQQQQQQQNRFVALASDEGEDEGDDESESEDDDGENEDEATMAGSSSSSSSSAPTSAPATTAPATTAPATTAAKHKPRMRVATVRSTNKTGCFGTNFEYAFATTQTTLEHIRHPGVPMGVLRSLLDAIAADNDAIYDEVCADDIRHIAMADCWVFWLLDAQKQLGPVLAHGHRHQGLSF